MKENGSVEKEKAGESRHFPTEASMKESGKETSFMAEEKYST